VGSRIGVLKIAARRLGVTPEEYQAKREAGFKWCVKCETWKPFAGFCADKSRGDGLASACRDCRNVRTTTGPGRKERQQQAGLGSAWCRACQTWLPTDQIHQGLCRKHINEAARAHYASNEAHRVTRRQHAHSRKRNVMPMPHEGQQYRAESFGGHCAYCGEPATTWDHVHPVAEGGDTTPDNILPACAPCNSSKGTRDVYEWLEATGRRPSERLIEWLAFMSHGIA
jgi:5-methylcytosine-specific restriction endonuclease McrA